MTADRERGSAVVEFVLVIPVLIVLLLFVVFCGRLQGANQDLHAAAGASARSATLAQTRPGAVRAAQRTADKTLSDHKVTCLSLQVDIDVTGAGGPGVELNNGDEVTVTVNCVVSLKDVTGLQVGADRTLSSSSTEIVDEYRGL